MMKIKFELVIIFISISAIIMASVFFTFMFVPETRKKKEKVEEGSAWEYQRRLIRKNVIVTIIRCILCDCLVTAGFCLFFPISAKPQEDHICPISEHLFAF